MHQLQISGESVNYLSESKQFWYASCNSWEINIDLEDIRESTRNMYISIYTYIYSTS